MRLLDKLNIYIKKNGFDIITQRVKGEYYKMIISKNKKYFTFKMNIDAYEVYPNFNINHWIKEIDIKTIDKKIFINSKINDIISKI